LEEIIELLVIDLQERAVHGEAELWVVINFLLELNEDLIDGLGDDAELALVVKEVIGPVAKGP
jgi:hypothetical protein